MKQLGIVLVLVGLTFAVIRQSTDGTYCHQDGRCVPLRLQFNNTLTTELVFIGPETTQNEAWQRYNISVAYVDPEQTLIEQLLWELKYSTTGSTMVGYFEALFTDLMALDWTRYNGCPEYGGAFGVDNARYMANAAYKAPSFGDKPNAFTVLGHYGLDPEIEVAEHITFTADLKYHSKLRDVKTGRIVYETKVQVLSGEEVPPFSVQDCFYYIGRLGAGYSAIPCTYLTAGWYYHVWNSSTDEFICNHRFYPDLCPGPEMQPQVFNIFPGVNPYEFLPVDNVQMNALHSYLKHSVPKSVPTPLVTRIPRLN